MTKICLVSDTHEMMNLVKVPDCDILIHCGDATGLGHVDKLLEFNKIAKNLKKAGTCKEVVFIPGNHDISLDVTHPAMAKNRTVGRRIHEKARAALKDMHLLIDAGIELMGVKIWGSPWTPRFYGWAFMYDDDGLAYSHWKRIPEGLDVLITHGPPKGILDLTDDNRPAGSALLHDITFLKKPKIHAFGHIHSGYGETKIQGIHFINAAACTEQYIPSNPPIVVEL